MARLQLNAWATYDSQGRPVVYVAKELLSTLNTLSILIAYGEIIDPNDGSLKVTLYALAKAHAADLPDSPTIPPDKRDAIMKRAERLYLGMVYYVAAHECAHHALGHIRSAYQALGFDTTTSRRDIHKLAKLAEDRDKEVAADTAAAVITKTACGDDGAAAILYFCEFMIIREQYLGAPDEYLSDHPNWKTRLEWMKRILAES